MAQAAADWLAYVKTEGRERTTVEHYKQHVDMHILPRLGKVKLAALTTPRINAFRDDLLASISIRTREKMTRITARKVLVSLKALSKTPSGAATLPRTSPPTLPSSSTTAVAASSRSASTSLA